MGDCEPFCIYILDNQLCKYFTMWVLQTENWKSNVYYIETINETKKK